MHRVSCTIDMWPTIHCKAGPPNPRETPDPAEIAGTTCDPPAHTHLSLSLAIYLIPLNLQPEEHIVLEELSFQSHKVLELQTSDGIEEGPSKQQDLFGGSHPQASVLQGNRAQKCWSSVENHLTEGTLVQEHIYIINLLYVHLNSTRGYGSNRKCVTDELQYSIGRKMR